ncbi:response regulator [Haliscomenobacter hydrossis]|uniref:Response regulator receiver n=1 Tax=Haliscomenobacter hydrossis (strain ATCC 27775 / DSM 1100 / LMG 10767 / O) TaxID=760192 RepID=F4L000_HALH1|nr:response regulator [Haliscomenobacter hydrossis]AEE51570.1 response regulator receiver [Haliscomenobacter hydrossis DSM 1100]
MINDLILVTNSANSASSRKHFTDILNFGEYLELAIPAEWKAQPREFYLYITYSELEPKLAATQFKGIVIDLFLENSKSTDSNIAVDLAAFLRLCDIDLPIIIVSEKHLTSEKYGLDIDPRSYQILNDFKVGKFLTYDQAFNKELSVDDPQHFPIYKHIRGYKFNIAEFLKNFSVIPSDDRHQMTNEWGAIKLAFNAGYTLEDIGYNFPQNTYFKYLQKKFSLDFLTFAEREELLKEYSLPTTQNKINLSTFLKNKKILLVDDNAEKGWASVLEKIFDARIVSMSSIHDCLKIDHKEYASFDLVFLDLYMPNFHGNLKEKENSIKLLETFKIGFPQIPIIVFTASNKSWTLDEVLEKGADGMYVKESPEYAGNATYSRENFKNFFSTIANCLKRYKTLQPYWSNIDFIFQNFLPEIDDINAFKFKSRIKERLEMFFGLLKRGLEEKGFNSRKFYFSDNELAFITLWSILNEISQAYYEKSRPNIQIRDPKGNLISAHPSGTLIEYSPRHYKWSIKNQQDVFLEYVYFFEIEREKIVLHSNKNYYKLNCKSKSIFKFHRGKGTVLHQPSVPDVDYSRSLYVQIAFLLEKKITLLSPKKDRLQEKLSQLNEKRNKLFLTHGEEDSRFYNKTEKSKRSERSYEITPNGDIKELFELVGFLLTGKEIVLNI